MTFKENLKKKRHLDKLLHQIASTIKEAPKQRWVDKPLTGEILDMTDFVPQDIRDLRLYVRPLEGGIMEVLVFDNELPIYHSTVEDVALRKSPYWQEMVSIGNIIKILNDKDVVASKGKESLKRIYANALARMDLGYSREDLEPIVEDARWGLERKSTPEIEEALDLFLALVDFQPVSVDGLASDVRLFAGPESTSATPPGPGHLILFDPNKRMIGLKEGVLLPLSDSDLDWIRRYARGEQPADIQGVDVFEFLSKLALERSRN